MRWNSASVVMWCCCCKVE